MIGELISSEPSQLQRFHGEENKRNDSVLKFQLNSSSLIIS